MKSSVLLGIFFSLVAHLLIFISLSKDTRTVVVQNSMSSLVVTVRTIEPITSSNGERKAQKSSLQKGQAGVISAKKVEIIGALAPIYPWRSRANNEEGEVEMIFFVNELGQATDVKVSKSSGFESLDEAAVEAVRKAQFKNSVGLPQEMKIGLNFKLNEKNGI